MKKRFFVMLLAVTVLACTASSACCGLSYEQQKELSGIEAQQLEIATQQLNIATQIVALHDRQIMLSQKQNELSRRAMTIHAAMNLTSPAADVIFDAPVVKETKPLYVEKKPEPAAEETEFANTDEFPVHKAAKLGAGWESAEREYADNEKAIEEAYRKSKQELADKLSGCADEKPVKPLFKSETVGSTE